VSAVQFCPKPPLESKRKGKKHPKREKCEDNESEAFRFGKIEIRNGASTTKYPPDPAKDGWGYMIGIYNKLAP
jgi:hypothetical protein